ncbi:MAG: hypothetical protein M2R45_02740 [Verrucomicrobia subdivision 3 bacterium]|nr:hypothetical protein [Limisphaerales bacterium]MCS1414290.1 hypothetical protein [Limisphaerales bacterium]
MTVPEATGIWLILMTYPCCDILSRGGFNIISLRRDKSLVPQPATVSMSCTNCFERLPLAGD